MKAYVIKNKEGKYLRGFDIISYETDFCEDIIDASIFETKEYAECQVFGTGLKDYKIVPITICEGNLEEENRVLKEALSGAIIKADELIETIYRNDCCCYAEMPNEEYFIQQAKENEKDDRTNT